MRRSGRTSPPTALAADKAIAGGPDGPAREAVERRGDQQRRAGSSERDVTAGVLAADLVVVLVGADDEARPAGAPLWSPRRLSIDAQQPDA